MARKKEYVYVTYTCKKCGCAFIDIDPFDDINDIPLNTRYCPDCAKLGYKNDKFKKNIPSLEFRIEQLLKEHNVIDKKDIIFVKKTCNKYLEEKRKYGDRIILKNIFKQALEVLSYQDWKVDGYEQIKTNSSI